MPRTPLSLLLVRVVLPCAIFVAGLVLIAIGTTAPLGFALLVAAPLVWFADWLMRLGLRSERDREDEERARRHLTLTGHWPDEESKR